MEQYIKKSALVAEIEKRINFNVKLNAHSRLDECNAILSFVNNLEVKEVDLEKALSDLDREIKDFVTTDEFEKDSAIGGHYWAIAKHAFLFGLKTQKGE